MFCIQVDEQLIRVDLQMKRLLDGLEAAGLISCVNIILVADHGMAPSGPEYVIKLSEYIPDISDEAYTFTGAFTRIDPKNDSEGMKILCLSVT